MKTYRVGADERGSGNGYGPRFRRTKTSVEFLVAASHYKEAWTSARRICRTGGTVDLLGEGDEPSKHGLEPGLYIVYRVDSFDGAKRSVATDDAEPSGRFLLRLPEALHGELARRAQALGESLNAYCVVTLGNAVGYRGPSVRER